VTAPPLSLDDLRAVVVDMLDGVDDGDPLDAPTAGLVALAVHATPSVLDADGTREWIEYTLDAGATAEQVHETLLLVSGLGVHTLMEGSRCLAAILRERGYRLPERDARRQELWERFVGADPYWKRVEAEMPGFLDALLRLSPEGFEAFFEYCAVPWRGGALRAGVKELISLAVDATPTHRYLPGLRLHVANALDVGVGRQAILQALDVAASSPPHRGAR
jgi:alkylhydroperoxidase/carboxymuconolactone decarboxylase family protein YurZ